MARNWVQQEKAWSFTEGFLQAADYAATLLERENLLVVAAWLRNSLTELKPEGQFGRSFGPDPDRDIQEHADTLPNLQQLLTESSDTKRAAVDVDAERLKRAAPDLLAALNRDICEDMRMAPDEFFAQHIADVI